MPDNKLDEIIKRILQVVIPDKIILFGSRARGEEKPDSDYDILVIKSGIESERQIAQSIYVNLIGIKAKVDIIVKTPENLENSTKRLVSATKEAINEGIVIYE